MPPNSTVPPTPTIVQPPSSPAAPPAPVKASSTNYAAALFFTLIIVGFTFHLPTLLYVPIVFFTLVAGTLFIGDSLAGRRRSRAAQPEAVRPPSLLSQILKGIFIVLAVIGILIVGYVAFVIVALSSGGGF